MPHILSFVSNFRNENPYLGDWIEYHLHNGVDHLYLFDQDGSEEARNILRPFVASGRVTVHEWYNIDRKWDFTFKPSGKTQFFQKNRKHLAYSFAARKYRKETLWLLKIDLDEFLVMPPELGSIQSFLKSIDTEKNRALRVPRYDFGDNGYVARPNLRVSEAYLHREASPSNYKDIASARFLNGNHFCNSSHRWSYRIKGHLGRTPIQDLSSESVIGLRIHHYYTKSRQEYFERQNISGGRKIGDSAYAAIQQRTNEVEDRTILSLLPPAK